jgi:hypothetical protein
MSTDNPMNKIKTWQQGRFIDGPDYRNWPNLEKIEAEKNEKHKVRPGKKENSICFCPNPDDAAWIAERLNLAAKLEKENAILKKGIAAVRDLIDGSNGVSGLHLNGDIADWDSLCEGGIFEEWLIDFNEAESLLLIIEVEMDFNKSQINFEEAELRLFEQWASDPCRSEKLPLDKHQNGAYKDFRTYLAFYGWKSRAGLNIEAVNKREAGWYWVARKNEESLDGWSPAYWDPETKHFRSAFFSGVPESEFIVGQELTAPDYNATLKAIADLKVFDNG